MVDLLGRIAERQPDPDPENAVGDAAVIGGAAVNAGQSDTVSDYLVGVQFSVDPHPVAQRAGVIEIVQKHIIETGNPPAAHHSRHLRKPDQGSTSCPEVGELQVATMFRAERRGAGIADRQLRDPRKLPLGSQQRPVAAVGDHQRKVPLRFLQSEFAEQRTDILQIFTHQFDLHNFTP